jgi:4-oxalocrotonate tautomerase
MIAMAIVGITVTREGSAPNRTGVTADEKAALIKSGSQLLLEVSYKPLETTFVIIEDVDLGGLGVARLPVEVYRRQRARDRSRRRSEQ